MTVQDDTICHAAVTIHNIPVYITTQSETIELYLKHDQKAI